MPKIDKSGIQLGNNDTTRNKNKKKTVVFFYDINAKYVLLFTSKYIKI